MSDGTESEAFMATLDALTAQYGPGTFENIIQEAPAGTKEQMKYLVDSGTKAMRVGFADTAVQLYKAALRIASEQGDSQMLAHINNRLGTAYIRQGSRENASAHLNRALKMAQETDNKKELSFAKLGIGKLKYKGGQYDAAIDVYKDCRQTVPQMDVEDRQRCLAELLRLLGAAYYRIGSYEEADKCFAESMAISEDINDKLGIALTRFRLGMVNNKKKNYFEALDHYKLAGEVFLENDMYYQLTKALIGQGEVLFTVGETDQSIARYILSERINRIIGDKYGLGIALGLQALVHVYKGEANTAIQYYTLNLRLCKETNAMFGEAMTHRHIGVLHYMKCEYEPALGHLHEAMELFKAMNSAEVVDTEKTIKVVMQEMEE